jgi:protein TonB
VALARAISVSLAVHAVAAAAIVALPVLVPRAGDDVVLPELMGRRGAAVADAEGAAAPFAATIRREPARAEAVREPLVAGAEPLPDPAPDPPPAVLTPPAAPSAPDRPASIGPGSRRFLGNAPLPRPAPAAAPAAPAPGFAAVRAADLPPPTYPRRCLLLRHEGVVLIDVRVSAQGDVLEAHVAAPSPCPELDEAALTAVRAARYVPGRRGGVAVEMTVRQPIRFELPK